MSDTEKELLDLSHKCPSTVHLSQEWDPEYLDQTGYEIWADVLFPYNTPTSQKSNLQSSLAM